MPCRSAAGRRTYSGPRPGQHGLAVQRREALLPRTCRSTGEADRRYRFCTTMTEEQEIWAWVPGFEGRYQVSTFGRIYSVFSKRCLTLEVSERGYVRIRLGNNGPKFHVASLVLGAFVGPRPSRKHEAAHNDGDRKHNAINNLRWATARENCEDKRIHGTLVQGSKQWCSKLNEENVKAIRESSDTQRVLAARYGVSKSLIGQVRSGKWWKHV